MALSDVRTFALEHSNLAELRELVAALETWPGHAEVRVKGRIEFDMRGPRIASVSVDIPVGDRA